MMEKGNEILKAYLAQKSERNFRAIVEQHSPIVLATANRYLKDSSLAQDVSQQVFIRLARSAPRLNPKICLSGWLYRQTCRISLDTIKANQRRRERESSAATLMNKESGPADHALLGEIDEALNQLGGADRDALVLRYLEQRSHRSVGECLGVSEEAARKRCERAVEALRVSFSQRGRGITAAVLVSALSGISIKPVSGKVVEQISGAAFQKSGSIPTALAGILSFTGGLGMVALISGGIYLAGDRNPSKESEVPLKNRHQASSSHRKTLRKINGDLSTETLVAELKRLYLEPRNALMKARMEALFESIPGSGKSALLFELEEILTTHEKTFAYRPFLENWVAEDPERAFDAILTAELISGSLASDLGMIELFFRQWNRRDASGSENWLLQNWGHRELTTEAFESTIQSFMARPFIINSMNTDGVDAAFAKAASFGNLEDFPGNLRALTGTSWNQVDQNFAVDIFKKIRTIEDLALRDQLTLEMLSNWKKRLGQHLLDSLADLTPRDRIPASLFTLSYQPPKITTTRRANGGSVSHLDYPKLAGDALVHMQEEREEGIRRDALEIGMSAVEADFLIARQYKEDKSDRFQKIVARLPEGPSTDQLIVDGVRQRCLNHNRGIATDELISLESALLISDQSTRNGVVRALYHRIYSKDPTAATEMLRSNHLPPDVAGIIRETAKNLGL